ncbi:AI-2E family transporter [Agromyces archimandritae]|uniref:AI-2E family transporter n=1 Tax=Agromyces archimandritae TaxID=2781962 RepID=UPI001FD5F39F|nr:AI-2E family transporter [Agromyces archimandritae]
MRTADRGQQGAGDSLFARAPLRWGFTVTLGLLGALLIGYAVVNLSGVLVSVFVAAFIALGLDPLVHWFQRRGMRRGAAVTTVILLFAAAAAIVVWIIVPPVVTQIVTLVQTVPAQIADLEAQPWFTELDEATNGVADGFVVWLGDALADPELWADIGGGALAFGVSVLDGVSTGIFVFILTIYFIASLDQTKRAMLSLVAGSHRPVVADYAERIMRSIGSYLSGMAVLAFVNAVFSTILLSLVGVRYALIIGVLALFITLIPLIGTIITTAIMTVVALLVSPVSAVVVLAAMLVYMQVEAYVLTPRVMSKAVQVPGAIVLISALAGGTLLGLLGALVAIPVSAGILLIIREIVVPRQAKK